MGVWSLSGLSFLASDYNDYVYGPDELTTGFAVAGLIFAVWGLVDAVMIFAGGDDEVAKWQSELDRLQAIGQQKNWVYLGRYIPDPSQNVNVYVHEDPAATYARLLGELLHGLSGP